MDDLIAAAKLVIARWEHGDLAEAVRELEIALEIARAERRLNDGKMF